MPDMEKVIEALQYMISENCTETQFDYTDDIESAIALLKEQENLLGIQQTSDSITFISTGTAQQGEERGIMLGKSWMHEWLKKELLHRGLLTDEIRAVFDEAKRQEGR